jgi:hypothetical protein
MPIDGKELDELTAKAGVTGLSTIDVRRLLSNYRRLRQLVLDAQRVMGTNGHPDDTAVVEKVLAALRDEAKRG